MQNASLHKVPTNFAPEDSSNFYAIAARDKALAKLAIALFIEDLHRR
ncbi:hypothetical protein [Oscillatoria sp. FACHB-1406]|nr:hypothetical protein [Oscillatoria sp. FACHB-1406]MBD2577574.1 hypothetical protein [Oscillatoria sp. FACHB-1406]